MPRGFTWCEYQDDDGRPWAIRVSDLYQAMPERGWLLLQDAELPQMPRSWRERRVFGFDAAGHKRTAECGTVTCDLWTGAVGDFWLMGNDGQLVNVAIVGRLQEHRIVLVPTPAGLRQARRGAS